MQLFIIPGRLDGLNEYIDFCRKNKYAGAKAKKENQGKVVAAIIDSCHIEKITSFPITLKIKWVEKNKRRDIDNVTFGTKFIQDAMVEMGIIPDDSQKFINGIVHEVTVDKDNPHIEVEVI